MFNLNWKTLAIALALCTASVRAVDPSPAVKKLWDDKCKAKYGQDYYMVFDSNGNPTPQCVAPPFKGCYWGPYTDPKTGAAGCCEKGNGDFSTDPIATLEGGCCVAPKKYSFDGNVGRGGCCPPGEFMTWDDSVQPLPQSGHCCAAGLVTSIDQATNQPHCCPRGLKYASDSNSGQGDCCKPGQIFSYNPTAQRGQCCDSGSTYKIDAVTGVGSCCAATEDFRCDCKCIPSDVDPQCPTHHGDIIQNGGKKWKIFCGLINHGDNDISTTQGVPSWGQCIKNCAQNAQCVRAIYNPTTSTCYLRSHGNKVDAATPGPYSSAHLVEDDSSTSSGTGNSNGSGQTSSTGMGDPKHCHDVDGRIVDIGGAIDASQSGSLMSAVPIKKR
ncbi:hypothetical protein F4778DRAFT_787945 [Xylariomycetidae sp. FL2044]|nr:hypothetical protein F4778DRAFT_787945 [Xylariomycetidae sp. FL2044]